MKRRKIQKIGQDSYSVSLPKGWVKKNELKAGDYLFLSENPEGDLTVARGPGSQQPQTTVTILYDADFDRNLTMYYLRGVQEIEVQMPEQRVFTATARGYVVEKTRELMGLEVFEEKRDSIKFRILSSIPKEPLRDIILRIFKLTHQMVKDLVAVLIRSDDLNVELLKNIIARDSEVNRWYFLSVRQIRDFFQKYDIGPNGHNLPALKYLDYRIMCHNLEVIGDRCVHSAKILLETRDKINDHPNIRNDLGQLAKLVLDNFQKTLSAFLASDPNRAAEIIMKKSDFIGEAEKVNSQFRMVVNQIASVILPAMELFQKLRDIFELSIDLCDLIS